MKMHQTIAIVGGGRMGRALTDALGAAGVRVTGPHGRGFAGADADAVLLCVPDGQIAGAAAAVAPGPLVGHCSHDLEPSARVSVCVSRAARGPVDDARRDVRDDHRRRECTRREARRRVDDASR